ncbi:Teneurin-3 [Manis pentadactyla]|nr:Teneurin-3 [Manis pentadactyla]
MAAHCSPTPLRVPLTCGGKVLRLRTKHPLRARGRYRFSTNSYRALDEPSGSPLGRPLSRGLCLASGRSPAGWCGARCHLRARHPFRRL